MSAPTRARVEEAARGAQLRDQLAARALVTGRSAVVGAIVHDITDPYFSGVVRGLQDEAVAEGLVVLVGNDDREADKLESYLTMMLSQKPAGVVLVGGQVRDPARRCVSVAGGRSGCAVRTCPVAAVGRYELDIPHVAVDDAARHERGGRPSPRAGPHRRSPSSAAPLDSTTVEDRYAATSPR